MSRFNNRVGCMVYKFIKYGAIDTSHFLNCDVCGEVIISKVYKEIIDNLKQAEIIQDDYPMICCKCFIDLKPKGSGNR